jgi:hypothetical protein
MADTVGQQPAPCALLEQGRSAYEEHATKFYSGSSFPSWDSMPHWRRDWWVNLVARHATPAAESEG